MWPAPIECPPRRVVQRMDAGTLLLMPAVSRQLSITKSVTMHAANRGTGLPTRQSEVLVMDTCRGKRLMQFDGPILTARHTVAVSLLAARCPGVFGARKVLLVGSGAQALAHAQAIAALLPQAGLSEQGRSEAQSNAFAGQLAALGIAQHKA